MSQVELSTEPFGVRRQAASALALELQPRCVYAYVSGFPALRHKTSAVLAKGGTHPLMLHYDEAVREAQTYHGHKHFPGDYMLGGLAWSIIRADIGRAVELGKPVVVDVEFSDSMEMQKFTESCFMRGAVAVTALCHTTEYEETWEEDGFTGVIWLV